MQGAAPFAVLFVCTANVCRSPYAELICRARIGPNGAARFSSAGTDGFRPQPIDPPMAVELANRGVTSTKIFGTRYAAADLAGADLILTMSRDQLTRVVDEVPMCFAKAFTLGQFTRGLEGLGRRLVPADLVSLIARQRPAHGPSDDVPDPYGRGSAAAAEAATIIDAHLDRLLPRLT